MSVVGGSSAPAQGLADVDVGASAEDHLRRMNGSCAEGYIKAALDPALPVRTRGRALAAAITYVSSLASSHGCTLSQSCAPLSQHGRQAHHGMTIEKLANTIATLVDDTLTPQTLIRAATAASENALGPVLVKVLCVLAQCTESVPGDRDIDISDGHDAGSDETGSSSDPLSDDCASEKGDHLLDNDKSLLGVRHKRALQRSANSSERLLKQAKTCLKPSVSSKTGQDFVNDFVIKLTQTGLREQHSEGSRARHRGIGDVLVATVAREVPLSPQAAMAVTWNLQLRLPTVPIEELPAYIYQVLLFLLARGNGQAKRIFLHAVVFVFADLEQTADQAMAAASQAQEADEDNIIFDRSMSRPELRQVQGAALLHIDYALRQDPGLVSELLKLARLSIDSPESIMTPFGIAVLLAISRAPSRQGVFIPILCDAVSKFISETRTRSCNPFAASICKADERLLDPRSSLLAVADLAGEGEWDMVCEALLQLSFGLMEKNVVSDGAEDSDLASQILYKLFCRHAAMRAEVMDQLIARIGLGQKYSHRAIHVMSLLTQNALAFVLDFAGKLKDLVADLVNYPPWTSCAVLDALLPVFKTRPEIQDAVFLVLRKAFFHRESSARAVAGTGFLRLMLSCLRGDPSVVGWQSSDSEVAGRTSFDEALLPIRRILTHSPALRALFYKETRSIVKSHDSPHNRIAFCAAMRDLLHPHVLKFVDSSQSPFIKLEQCVTEDGTISECLGDLLECLTAVEVGAERPLSESYLLDLAKKVASLSIQDFQISKEPCAALASLEGVEDEGRSGHEGESLCAPDKANRNRARILGGVADALLNVAFSIDLSLHTPQHYTEVVLPLLHLRDDILSTLKHLGASSLADTMRDMGSNPVLERVRHRGLPGSGTAARGSSGMERYEEPQKGKSSKARKGGQTFGLSAAGLASAGEAQCRFGMFGILLSSAERPPLDFAVAVRCLDLISGRRKGHSTSSGQVAESIRIRGLTNDHVLLSSFLRAAAKLHIEHVLERGARAPADELNLSSFSCDQALVESLTRLVAASVAEFQYYRAASGAAASRCALRSLEIVELCVRAVKICQREDGGVVSELFSCLVPETFSGEGTKLAASMASQPMRSLQRVVESLVEDGQHREAHVVLRILSAVSDLRDWRVPFNADLPRAVAAPSSAEWAAECLTRFEKVDASVTKALVSMSLPCRADTKTFEACLEISRCIRVALGDCGAQGCAAVAAAETGGQALEHAPIIRQESALPVVEVVLGVVEGALNDIDWALSRVSTFEHAVKDYQLVIDFAQEWRVEPPSRFCGHQSRLKRLERSVLCAENAAHERIQTTVDILTELLSTAVAKWSYQELLLKAVTRCYRALCLAVTLQARRRGDPRAPFLNSVDRAKELGPTLWHYLAFLSSSDKRMHDAGEERAGRQGISASKEARVMPPLVYEVEKFEKLLIFAQKHTKVKLLAGMKRNTARDFRIATDCLTDEEQGHGRAGAECSDI